MKYHNIFLAITIVALFSGCTPRGPKTPDEAAGEYVFGYPKTREVETIILRPDETFLQQLYTNLETYHNNGTPTYTNSGNWTYDRNSITFSKYLVFCSNAVPDLRINPPVIYGLYYASWIPPSRRRNAILLVSPDFQYSFIRVTNRQDVVAEP